MRHPLWSSLHRWLLTWLLCFALALALGELPGLNIRWWLAAAALLLWCAMLAAAEYFGRFWGKLALCAVALGVCLLVSNREVLTEAARAVLSRTAPASGGELLALLLCAAAALPISALLRYYWIRLALSLSIFGLWVAAAVLEWPVPRLLPAALLPLLLLTLCETIRRLRHEPEPDKLQKSALLLSLLPAALLLGVLPARSEPYDYPLLHSAAESAERLWHDVETALRFRQRGDGEFGVRFNGLSDKADVGGSVEEESAGVVYVWPEREPDGFLYLFGNAWDRFDGRGWSSALKPETAQYLSSRLDTAERIYALWRLCIERGGDLEYSDCFRPNSVYLSCRNLNVRTLFTASNTTRIHTDAKRFPYADTPTGSLFDYVQRDEVWYRVYFLESNVRTGGALLTAAEGKTYDAEAYGPRWNRIAEDLDADIDLDLGGNLNLEKTFAERAALIRSAFLDTSGVSDRARALTEEITADCGSDAERIAAIAAYLQDNYRYTLSPAPVPRGESFLDWLLFEGREGYCTWYATAAALMARSVGIPSRFVQGYRGRAAGEGFTALGPENAHAWCECYISGYGWVTVEATPGFAGESIGWLTKAEELTLYGGGEESAESPAEEAPGSVGASPRPAAQSAQDGETGEDAPEPDSVPSSFGWLPTALIAALAAALPGLWLWLRSRRRRRYERADGAMRLQLDLERLLRDLRGKGYPRRPEEPLREYFARLPWRYLPAEEAEAEEMAALYDRTFFSDYVPDEAELQKHRAFAARFRPKTLRQWMIWYRLQL